MNATSTHDDLDVDLDLLGQQPLLRIYTQICSIYPITDPSAHTSIIDTLTKGLERLTASFPWVAGQVVNEGASGENTGIFKIKPLERIPRLTVKDLRNDASAPTFAQLQREEFPMRLLDEDVIAPCRTLPGGPGWSATAPEPVLLIQANFIAGGLIITFNGQHSTMDLTGQGEVIRLFSKACRGEEFTEEEVRNGNHPRADVVPLYGDDFTPGPELENLIVKPPSLDVETDAKSQAPPAPPTSWAYFSFSPESLVALKTTATSSLPDSSQFVSTDDSISALIWQSIARARTPRLGSSDTSLFGRAVDARLLVGAPATYPGLLQNMAFSRLTLGELSGQPLGAVASKLRAALAKDRLLHQTRSLATYLDRTPNKALYSFSATVNPSSDWMLSSWSKVNAWEWDFGLGLGNPVAVRRPLFTPFECLGYLMPKRPDGEVSAAISLRDEDMERLKGDVEFTRYAKYIG